MADTPNGSGIDIVKECGFIIAITGETPGSISGITTKFRINCRVIKTLWKEVDAVPLDAAFDAFWA